jgi:hypothetical protein
LGDIDTDKEIILKWILEIQGDSTGSGYGQMQAFVDMVMNLQVL